ncbi:MULTISPECIES: type IV pilus modification protein PilV [unclassified Colwellia]|jgi:type IV pilus assembly protein PilV|uniref:type IV pilus modification protein PilV n=1 Tax=unclassified Colwellia TaxID=196834 RepID=UPI0015F65196|nr:MULTISPECIES: type IV pilus modification protein PilV [unclassified Colwellia]MBA6253691.1 type IV pilus modification protein PilV [Colwellia sp. MB3u-55]MBA6396597.1 type IV pilus modification protein PilV [Colwellia sp. BRX10-4]
MGNSTLRTSYPKRKPPQVQKGMTLIEVLVALVILVTGIFGAVAMQASAKKGSFDAMQRSVASALAQDIIERMRSNDSDILTLESYQGVYGAALNTPPDADVRCNSVASLCTSAQMTTNDLYEWEVKLMGADVTAGGKNTGGLVGAVGCIDHNKNAVTVVISWQGRVATADGYDADNNSSAAATLANACGTSTRKRRQVTVEAFIY